jgi:hypothetical protein
VGQEDFKPEGTGSGGLLVVIRQQPTKAQAFHGRQVQSV